MEDTKRCKKYYKILTENPDPKQDMTMTHWLYDTYIDHGSKYLDDILNRYEDAPENMKPQLDALLARIYENQGDKKNADIYNRKLKEYAKKLDKKLSEQQEGKKDVE